MLKHENIIPEKMAYDRPSDKLLKFLKKYYNLRNYIPQNNNFVIYNEYFYTDNSSAKGQKFSQINDENNNDFNYYENNNGYLKKNNNNYNNKCMIPTHSSKQFSTKKRGISY